MLALVLLSVNVAGDAVPLPHAHAHNDYEHARPFFDATERGFLSLEADVFLVDGTLWVAHERAHLKPERTLKSLYLEPLARRHRAGIPELTLMVDIKADGAAATARLKEELKAYASMISRPGHKGSVQVVVSGAGDRELIGNDEERWMFLDGRPGDLERPAEPWIAWVSDAWPRHFSWYGEGAIPEGQSAKLQRMVQAAHARGYRLRFWMTPEREAVWTVLRDHQVDLIGTDQLERLQSFFARNRDIPLTNAGTEQVNPALP